MSLNVLDLVTVLVVAAIYDPNKASCSATKIRTILADYYWGSNELRSGKTCDAPLMQMLCFKKCGKGYLCEDEDCICNDVVTKQLQITMRASDVDNRLHPYQDNQYMYSQKSDWPAALRTAIEKDSKPKATKLKNTKNTPKTFEKDVKSSQSMEHPALRHHIAHFCPNLKKARKCIRKCMKLGKPAFCGKDHVCYCGHRYTSHDDNKKIDVINVYTQYRDIYEKYFGPEIFENAESSSEEHDNEVMKTQLKKKVKGSKLTKTNKIF